MKKLIPIIAAFAALAGLTVTTGCTDDDETTWNKYTEWREANNDWLEEMKQRTNPDGTPYYQMVIPNWNPATYVLMHYFNDPAENADKLSPLYNSTIDVRYELHLYDGTPVDSSTNVTAYGAKGIFRTKLNEVVSGWNIALSQMHCGDTVEVILPYDVAYGTQNMGEILPYSNLRFNIRLVDIPLYELK